MVLALLMLAGVSPQAAFATESFDAVVDVDLETYWEDEFFEDDDWENWDYDDENEDDFNSDDEISLFSETDFHLHDAFVDLDLSAFDTYWEDDFFESADWENWHWGEECQDWEWDNNYIWKDCKDEVSLFATAANIVSIAEREYRNHGSRTLTNPNKYQRQPEGWSWNAAWCACLYHM